MEICRFNSLSSASYQHHRLQNVRDFGGAVLDTPKGHVRLNIEKEYKPLLNLLNTGNDNPGVTAVTGKKSMFNLQVSKNTSG